MFDYRMISISHGKDHTSESLGLLTQQILALERQKSALLLLQLFCLVMVLLLDFVI